MKALIDVDATQLFRRLSYIGAAVPSARRAATREMGASLIRALNARAPRDTNRYLRGWQMAGNNARVSNLTLVTVRRSGRHGQFVEALAAQAKFWQTMEEQLTEAYRHLYGYRENTPVRAAKGGRKRTPGLTKGQREMRRRIDKARHNHERAVQELERVMSHADAVILIGLFATVDKGAKGGGRTLTRTTRTKVYGGDGRIVDLPGETVLMLHNKEPHARLVENRTKVLAKAQAAVRALGAKTPGAAFHRQIEAASRAA